MKVLCAFGEHQYGDPSRGRSIEYTSFITAFRHLGHDVHHFESWNMRLYRDYSDLNAKLLACVESLNPDLLFTVQHDCEIWTESVQAVRSRGVLTVTWTTDDSWKYREVSRFIGKHYDLITTTYDYRLKDYRSDGIESAFLTQWAANDEWVRPPKPANQCRYPVSFVGLSYGRRREVVNFLDRNGIPVACFGHGWEAGSVPAESIPDIMNNSAISLNFSEGLKDTGERFQLKARTFEVPGAGGFLLTQDAPRLSEYYRTGMEIECFTTLPELLHKVRHYLAHPEERDRVAAAGFARTLKSHLYSQRLAGIVDAVRQRPSTPAQPTRNLASVNQLRLPRHMFYLRAVLVAACQRVWGERRGLQAARRLVFELSWRLAGERTFSSTGWPGRFFPNPMRNEVP